MENKKHTLLLAAIGVPYSITGKIDPNILPEKALCMASPLFYEDAKACSLVYTLLKNNFDLFDDSILSGQISQMKDILAAAILGGILHKTNKQHFKNSIKASQNLTYRAKSLSVKKPMRILADFGKVPFDNSLESLFGIKMNNIEAVDPKKTLPRETIISRNTHLMARDQGIIHLRIIEPTDAVEYVKMALCDQIILIAKKHDLKQIEIASLAHVTRPQISEVMNRKVERFTVDFLIEKAQLLINGLKSNRIADERINIPVAISPDLKA